MSDILNEFLEECEKEAYSVPIGFFYDPKEISPNQGIVLMFYTRWACFKGLMCFKSKELQAVFLKNLDFQKNLKSVRKILGGELMPGHFTEEGYAFTREYYEPGWKYSYFKDVGDVFPDCDDEEEIPDTPESYHLIETRLNKRFDQWILSKNRRENGDLAEDMHEDDEDEEPEKTEELKVMSKEEWIPKMKEVLAGKRNVKNGDLFHRLVYAAPTHEGQEVVDLLMESYINPFDEGTMQCCVNMLSDVGIEVYYESYFKYFWELKNSPDPDAVISLMVYIERELNDDDIEYILEKIRTLSPSGELKEEIDYIISSNDLEDEYPYSEIYYSDEGSCTMQDIIKELLDENEKIECSIPVIVFPDSRETKKNQGSLAIYYARWAYFHGLMSFKNEKLGKVFLEKCNTQKKLRLIEEILGNELLPSHFSKKGLAFTKKYYHQGWKHFYFNDFDKEFSNFNEFEDIPDTPKTYRRVEKFLSKRFKKWASKR